MKKYNIVWVHEQTELNQKFVCPQCQGIVVTDKSSVCIDCFAVFKWGELHLLIEGLDEED